ncbi:MAG: lamin tail domain-containing protein [Chlorobiota bacterium]
MNSIILIIILFFISISHNKAFEFGDVLINEIMFDVSQTGYEFIEIYNTTSDTIQIDNWYFADESDVLRNRTNSIISTLSLPPNGYAIIAHDSLAYYSTESELRPNVLMTESSFSLNNGGDMFQIMDSEMTVIDSVRYSDDWHEDYLTDTKDVSLEKLQPNLISNEETNWLSCTNEDGGTPLRTNSYTGVIANSGSISVTPNPYSPSSSSEPYIVIEFESGFRNALYDCIIYYENGSVARKLAESKFVAERGIITWNGRDDRGDILPLGPYPVVVTATDQRSGESVVLKELIVIAK